MEELKILVGMVKDLPGMALWLVFFYFVFKTAIVGSIFGILRLAIIKVHGWSVTPHHELVKTETEDATVSVDDLTMTGTRAELLVQLKRCKSAGGRIAYKSDYIHTRDVIWLAEAISNQKVADALAAQEERDAGN